MERLVVLAFSALIIAIMSVGVDIYRSGKK